MYGRAMQCDVCGNIKIVPATQDVYLVDGAPFGWIRLSVNQPLEDNYTYKTQSRTNVSNSIDACTLWCARRYLAECAEDMTEVPSE